MFERTFVWPGALGKEQIMAGAIFLAVLLGYLLLRHWIKDHIFKIFIGGILFFLWGYVLLSLTLMDRSMSSEGIQLRLFWTVEKAWREKDEVYWYFILGNLAFFTPLGILVPMFLKKRRSFLSVGAIAFLISLSIETAQLCSAKGLCEVDDLFHNTFGALIGYAVYLLVLWIFHGKSVRIYEKVLALFILLGWGGFFAYACYMEQPVFGYFFL